MKKQKIIISIIFTFVLFNLAFILTNIFTESSTSGNIYAMAIVEEEPGHTKIIWRNCGTTYYSCCTIYYPFGGESSWCVNTDDAPSISACDIVTNNRQYDYIDCPEAY